MAKFVRYEYTVDWDLSQEEKVVADHIRGLIHIFLDSWPHPSPIATVLTESPMIQSFLLRGAQSMWGWSSKNGTEQGISLSRHKYDKDPSAFALLYIKGFPEHMKNGSLFY